MNYGNTNYGVSTIFLPQNQHTQIKLLNFENWCSGVSKVTNFDFQSQFSVSKIIGIFLNFFLSEKYQFRSTFFVMFDNISVEITLLLSDA